MTVVDDAIRQILKKQKKEKIEIKCHSCKTINYIMIGGQKNER